MKRYPVQFPIPRFGLARAPLALALLVGGCATAPLAAAPETAAAAKEAQAVARSARTYPRFTDIPTLPEDVRPLASWGRAARDVMAAGTALEQATGEETWTLRSTGAFAQDALREAGPPAPAISATAGAEAFAREVRKRATPPPPPVR